MADKDNDGNLAYDLLEVEGQDGETTLEYQEYLGANSYYPFGLSFSHNTVVTENGDAFFLDKQGGVKNKYTYNGKEFLDDLDIGWHYSGFRVYDPAIGRFTSVDPIAEDFAFVSGFNYAENKPINSIDLHGLQSYPMYGSTGSSSPPKAKSKKSLHRGSFSAGHARAGGVSGTVGVGNVKAYNETSDYAFSNGVKGSVLAAEGSARYGDKDGLALVVDGKGSILSGEVNADAGLFSGQNGKRGLYIDLNAGVYGAEGELDSGIALGPLKVQRTFRGSAGNIDAGLTMGAYYDEEKDEYVFEGFQHFGFIV